MQKFEDNSTVIVTRGSKALAKDSEVTVLGHDSAADTYAVRTGAGEIRTVKASALGPKPERTFTESEVADALTEVVDSSGAAAVTPKDVTDSVARLLGLPF